MDRDRRRQQQRTETQAGGLRLVAFIQADPGLVQLIAHDYVAKLVESGDLIWGADLQTGAYEFIRAGRKEQLELAIDAALDALDQGNVREAVDQLASTLPPEAEDPDAEVADAEVIDDDEPAPDLEQAALGPGEGDDEGDVDPPPPPAARPRHRPKPAEPAAEGRRGRPSGMPHTGQAYDCVGTHADGTVCGARVAGEAAQFSHVRFGVILCSRCLPLYDARTGVVGERLDEATLRGEDDPEDEVLVDPDDLDDAGED